MEDSIYLRMRNRVEVNQNSRITLNDIAQIIAPDKYLKQLKEIFIYQVTKEDKNTVVIDVMKIIDVLKKKWSELDIQLVGPSQTIVEVIYKKRTVSLPFFIIIWLLLFIGSALAIMNFHEDVSMQEVHQKIYKMITGRTVNKPLILQIPYSIGLGLGMIIFFNHIFKKRFNEEPSPLEVEIFNYQQDLDQYVIVNENKEAIRHLDDH
ncbi:stage V sporulation protein AA [Heyndrickxia shackletonii]|uniref:Stage V sporulation protein AA n=1 Tax=Heyndrickxia shackletonii TaxID=157838 RepID=A0A0Q3WX91_9BACI|nr:stage V sporulation protein AA [Heyndrickxia shackletonii]KQL53650.1 stage V sporulation protein AA [Heyndrickxia shackletonii]MBB2480943.1 stage V sporulation protein AA [Bacillus sp. APMAM]NEZ00484.1 stage V sporulation protein AA [Heyndrickxia shackletonii]RTZ55699.1 stage V sporulation protein AA [Bacillus sp. SAJ1]